MSTQKIVDVKGVISPLTRTEENQLKGGFGNIHVASSMDGEAMDWFCSNDKNCSDGNFACSNDSNCSSSCTCSGDVSTGVD